MKLLIYDDPEDIVSREIINQKDTEVISVKDLFTNVSHNYNAKDHSLDIQWSINKKIVSNKKVDLLINRIKGSEVFIKNDSNFSKLHIEQMYVFINYIVQFFTKRTNESVCFGYPSSALPLLYQWKIINQNINILKAPKGYLSIYKNIPDDVLNQPHVVSTMYGYYHWKESHEPYVYSEKKRNLIFKKPKGKPVHIFYCFDQWTCSDKAISNIAIQKIIKEVTNLFQQNIAEILVFEKGQEISFGMINPFPGLAAQKLPKFKSVLRKGLGYGA